MPLENKAPAGVPEMLEPLSEGGFRFNCHPGVPCFTECCRDLKLILTSYDVLRLKNHLGLEAQDFLDRYTDMNVDEQHQLPMVYLNMQENERRTCPFVSPEGCRVYEDRPSACRTYPLARASRKHRLHGTVMESYYVLHESHCRGFEEDRLWSADEWIGDQGLEPYHEMNNLWMEIVTHPQMRRGLSMKQQQMFFMASYNVDAFRRFVFGSRFLQLFDLTSGEVDEFQNSDEALLRLAYQWLRFSFLNESDLKIRKEVEEEKSRGKV